MPMDELREDDSSNSSETDNYEDALDVAFESLASTPEIFGCELAQLDTLSHVDLCIALHPGIKTIVPTPSQIYHEIDEAAARELLFESENNPTVYDAAIEICVHNIRHGAPLPFCLKEFVARNLEGRFERKKRRGSKPDNRFAMRAFESKVARNDVTSKLSACDVVANAATALGVPIDYVKVRDWCQHRDHKEMRRRADSLNSFIKDEYLFKIGVLKRRRYP